MSDQQNSAQAGDASSDLSLDYLASAFASNGIIPPMMMRQLQSEAATAVTAGPGQIQNHADLLNAFLMAAAGVTSAGSDALPAPVLLCECCYLVGSIQLAALRMSWNGNTSCTPTTLPQFDKSN